MPHETLNELRRNFLAAAAVLGVVTIGAMIVMAWHSIACPPSCVQDNTEQRQ